MAWTIEYDPRAIRDLQKLARPIRADIVTYLDKRIAPAATPRDFCKSLRHDKFGLWRYRLGNYRIICEIRNHAKTILIIGVGHRKDIYC